MISNYIDIDIRLINVDSDRFQNRDKLDMQHVQEIAANFVQSDFDPVVLWRDNGGKIWMLKGHHRLEAFRLMKKSHITAQFFNGIEKKAIEYALNSNTTALNENDIERAKYYRGLLSKIPISKVQEQANKAHRANGIYIVDLAHLSIKGKALHTLSAINDSTDKGTRNKLTSICSWIGHVCRKHKLSLLQENECFNYLLERYSDKKKAGYFSSKNDFFAYIDAIIQRKKANNNYNTDNLLNLYNITEKTEIEKEYDSELSRLSANIKISQAELDEKRKELINCDATAEDIMRVLAKYEASVIVAQREYETYKSRGQQVKQAAKAQTNIFDDTQVDDTQVDDIPDQIELIHIASGQQYEHKIIIDRNRKVIALKFWNFVNERIYNLMISNGFNFNTEFCRYEKHISQQTIQFINQLI